MAGRGSADEPPPGAEVDRPGSEDPDVPIQTLRSWDQAEARLFPSVMARPDTYERMLTVIQAVLHQLRSTCPDIPALLAAAKRGADLVTDAVRASRSQAGHGPDAGAAGRPPPMAVLGTAGLRLDLISAAACAARYRELAVAQAARSRLAAFTRASDRPGTWTVVEQVGDQARALYQPYQRVEAHVPSGRAVIISIGPDETLSRAIWRLDEAALDLADGHLTVGDPIGSYAAAAECDNALAAARTRSA